MEFQKKNLRIFYNSITLFLNICNEKLYISFFNKYSQQQRKKSLIRLVRKKIEFFFFLSGRNAPLIKEVNLSLSFAESVNRISSSELLIIMINQFEEREEKAEAMVSGTLRKP